MADLPIGGYGDAQTIINNYLKTLPPIGPQQEARARITRRIQSFLASSKKVTNHDVITLEEACYLWKKQLFAIWQVLAVLEGNRLYAELVATMTAAFLTIQRPRLAPIAPSWLVGGIRRTIQELLGINVPFVGSTFLGGIILGDEDLAASALDAAPAITRNVGLLIQSVNNGLGISMQKPCDNLIPWKLNKNRPDRRTWREVRSRDEFAGQR